MPESPNMECVKTSQNCRSPAALICCKPQIQIQLQMAPITLQPTQCVSQHLNMFTINIYKKMTCTCKVKSIKSNIANGLSKNQIWKVLVNCLNPNLNPIRKLMKNKEALKQWRLQEEVEDGPHQRFISNPRKNQAAVWRMPISAKKTLFPFQLDHQQKSPLRWKSHLLLENNQQSHLQLKSNQQSARAQ